MRKHIERLIIFAIAMLIALALFAPKSFGQAIVRPKIFEVCKTLVRPITLSKAYEYKYDSTSLPICPLCADTSDCEIMVRLIVRGNESDNFVARLYFCEFCGNIFATRREKYTHPIIYINHEQ